MSLSQKLNNIVENEVKQFLISVSQKYDIDSIQLWKEWIELQGNTLALDDNINEIANEPPVSISDYFEKDVPSSPVPVDTDSKPVVTDTIPIPMKYLLTLKGQELKLLCVKNKISKSGNKEELVNKLAGISKVASKKTPKSKVLPVTTEIQHKLSDMLSKEQNMSLIVKRNQYDNYEHAETSFVFNKTTEQVYGVQNDDGSIRQLSEEDIETCNKYKFEYLRPSNLDLDDTTDVVIEDVSDEETDVDEEELLSDDSDDDIDEDIEDEY